MLLCYAGGSKKISARCACVDIRRRLSVHDDLAPARLSVVADTHTHAREARTQCRMIVCVSGDDSGRETGVRFISNEKKCHET